MRLSVFQRKAILLYQRLTELQLFDHEHDDHNNFRYIDKLHPRNNSATVATKTIEFWGHSKPKDGKKTDLALRTVQIILSKRFGDEAADAFMDDKISIDRFCKTIEFHRIRAHELIDRRHQQFRPSVGLFVKSEHDANAFMRKYGGLYYLYRIEQNTDLARNFRVDPSRKIISRCTVCVRYPIPLQKLPNHFHIRCKICVPAYNFNPANLKVHKLDGLVSDYRPVSNLMYWTLEHRAPPEGQTFSDLMSIESECEFKTDKDTGLSYLRGAMLTCSQNYGTLQQRRGRDVFMSSIIVIKYGTTCVEKVSKCKDEHDAEYNDFWFLKQRPHGRIIHGRAFMKTRTALFFPEEPKTSSDKLALRLLRSPWERMQVLTHLA